MAFLNHFFFHSEVLYALLLRRRYMNVWFSFILLFICNPEFSLIKFKNILLLFGVLCLLLWMSVFLTHFHFNYIFLGPLMMNDISCLHFNIDKMNASVREWHWSWKLVLVILQKIINRK